MKIDAYHEYRDNLLSKANVSQVGEEAVQEYLSNLGFNTKTTISAQGIRVDRMWIKLYSLEENKHFNYMFAAHVRIMCREELVFYPTAHDLKEYLLHYLPLYKLGA